MKWSRELSKIKTSRLRFNNLRFARRIMTHVHITYTEKEFIIVHNILADLNTLI